MSIVYADNAASTKIRQEVIDAMASCSERYGNPSCAHDMGQQSKDLINASRSQIAKSIGAKSNEIIFTSGGTEANNLALFGFLEANNADGNHIITTSIEHMSILRPIEYLLHGGYTVTYLPVNSDGIVDLQYLRGSIRSSTILISVMFANNETGSIQPIAEIGELANKYGICFHTDAIQAFGHCDIDVNKLGIDMLSISGHKIYAPKGVGALYVKNTIDMAPMVYGGGQEYGLRSGTENTDSIVGLGKAVELLDKTEKDYTNAHLSKLKNKLIDGIKTKIPDVKLNGSAQHGLSSIVNMSFDGVESETLLTMLNLNGIYASSGSACSSSHIRPSHVLKAMDVSDDLAYGSVRFSFGIYSKESDVDCILDVLTESIEKIRKGDL